MTPFLVSLTRHYDFDTTGVTPSTEASNYPARYVLQPQFPSLPWRTTATSQQTLVVDLLSAKELGLIALVGLNYTSLIVEAHTADSWGSPTWTSGVQAAGRNPWTERDDRSVWTRPALANGNPPVLRYVRLTILAQTPSDGAAYFATGGMHIGMLTSLPGGIRLDEMHETPQHRDVERTPSGRAQTIVYGEPSVLLHYRRQALTDDTEGGGVDLAAWKEMDRLMHQADYFAWAINRGNPAEALIVRKVNDSRWPISYPLTIDDLILEERV